MKKEGLVARDVMRRDVLTVRKSADVWELARLFTAGFILVFLLFTRVVPILTVWKIKEGQHEGH